MPNFSRPDTPLLALCSAPTAKKQGRRKPKGHPRERVLLASFDVRHTFACLSVFSFTLVLPSYAGCLLSSPVPSRAGPENLRCTNTRRRKTRRRTRPEATRTSLVSPSLQNPSGSLAQTSLALPSLAASHQHSCIFLASLSAIRHRAETPSTASSPRDPPPASREPQTQAWSPAAGRFPDTTP